MRSRAILWTGETLMNVRLERRYRFSASHLYRRPDWTEEENRPASANAPTSRGTATTTGSS